MANLSTLWLVCAGTCPITRTKVTSVPGVNIVQDFTESLILETTDDVSADLLNKVCTRLGILCDDDV